MTGPRATTVNIGLTVLHNLFQCYVLHDHVMKMTQYNVLTLHKVAGCYNHFLLDVLYLFLAMSWVGLQCVIVVYPGHTHLIFDHMSNNVFYLHPVLISIPLNYYMPVFKNTN